jgi:methyl-accepting chemotaxis protein PixJ
MPYLSQANQNNNDKHMTNDNLASAMQELEQTELIIASQPASQSQDSEGVIIKNEDGAQEELNNINNNGSPNNILAIITAIKTDLEGAKDAVNSESLHKILYLEKWAKELQARLSAKMAVAAEQQFKRQRQWLLTIVSRMRQSGHIDALFNIIVNEIRSYLQLERTLIFRFESEDQGVVIDESVVSGYTPSRGVSLPAIAFGAHNREGYQQQQLITLSDINHKTPNYYQQQLLEKFQVQASLSLPIRLNDQVWGLLVVQQCSRVSRQWQESEISLLYQIITELTLILQAAEFRAQIETQAEAEKNVTKAIDKIRACVDVNAILRIATQETRHHLHCDRVVVYRYHPDWGGEFVAESVGNDWLSLSEQDPALKGGVYKTLWQDTHLQETDRERYRYREISVVDDVYKFNQARCDLEFLEQFQVKAYVVVPIFAADKLWGLLVAHQNTGSRHWQESEIQLLSRFADQMGVAIHQAENLEKLHFKTNEIAKATKREKAIAKVLEKIRLATNLDTIFQIATQDVRKLLNVERLTIYKFRPDYYGDFVCESESGGWPKLVGSGWEDTYLQEHQGGRFRNNEPFVLDDIYTGGLSDCHVEMLEYFGVKSFAIVAIKHGQKLWGLLSAFQHSGPRHWEDGEIQVMMQLAAQLSVALQQADDQQMLRSSANQIAKAAEQERTVAKIMDKFRNVADLNSIFKIATQEVRKLLNVERLTIYKFRPDYYGDFVCESESGGWPKLVGSGWEDPYLQEHQGGRFRNNEPLMIDDIYNAGLTDCHVEALEYFGVKSCAVVAIKQGDKLWGLLSAFQHSGSRHWEDGEIKIVMEIAAQLGMALKQADYVEQLRNQATQIAKSAERERAITKVIEKIRNSSDIDTIFKIATQEVRKLLEVERLTIYKFRPDYFGDFVCESESGGLPKLVGSGWEDTYLQENQGGRFRNNQPFVADDIYNADLSVCHVEMLEYFGVKSFAVVAIMQGQKLWGLLSAFQHSSSRHWEDAEIQIMTQIAAQLGVALQQAEYLEQLQEQASQIAKSAERERAVTKVIEKIRNATDIDTIFKIATQEVRKLLSVERLTIYKFRPDYFGDFVCESESGGWPKLVGSAWEDTYLQEHQGGRFRNSEPLVVDDVYNGGLSDCHVEALEYFGVKSCAVVSIMQGQKLWGLLSAFQHSEPHHWEEGEIQVLTSIGAQLGVSLLQAEYIEELQVQSQRLAKSVERGTIYSRLVYRLGATLIQENFSVDSLLQLTVQELHRQLQTDRVAICRFHPDGTGTFIVEDVGSEWVKVVGTDLAQVEDIEFLNAKGSRYRRKQTVSIDNIDTAKSDDWHIQLRSQWGTQAYMSAPIFKGDQLWGLILALQNDAPRQWEEIDTNLLAQVALQIGLALQQAEHLQQLRSTTEKLTEAAVREKTAKEKLQQEVIQLLRAVRPALKGDLTVRAPITETEVGTVADAYNNTLQSLRQIIKQVQTASRQVAETSQNSESSISALASVAQQQYQSLSLALEQIQTMVNSTLSVGTSAQQVEAAAQVANQVVRQGDAAMNRTVDGILDIRETVAETSKRLTRLSESSQKVSKVVSLISNFTTQTQILALNAAIEATRAGEYGRGFGVVADEVRSLARQSADAATEIEQLVQEIQEGTAEVSIALEKGIEQVAQGTTMVNDAQANLNAIVEATTQISLLVDGITQATQLQTGQFQSVTQTMTEVAAIANKTSEDSLLISTSFKELLFMAQNLQTNADQFKVE